MADETPERDEVDAPPPAAAEKKPRRRASAAAEEAAEGAAAAAPVRARRTRAKPAGEPAADEAPKPRRARAAAKGPQEESAAEEAPKPRRVRARAPKAGGDAVEAPASEPAPKPPAPAAKKPPAKAGGARRLVGGRGRAAKDAPAKVQLVHAHARYVRSSARKARIVCDHIRGKSVPEARAILAFAPRGVAKDWAKLLDSAVANAEHNHELIGDELHVKQVFADVGPTLKRFRPRAMGRATPINKRTAHLSITLAPKE
jgi:ribosomal protein L22